MFANKRHVMVPRSSAPQSTVASKMFSNPANCATAFLQRSVKHFVRRALRDDAALFHHQHALAQRNHFFSAVRDVENRNAMRLVPLPQIVEDLSLGCGVQSRQRLVKQEHAQGRSPATRQRDSLALSAGDLRRPLLRK